MVEQPVESGRTGTDRAALAFGLGILLVIAVAILLVSYFLSGWLFGDLGYACEVTPMHRPIALWFADVNPEVCMQQVRGYEFPIRAWNTIMIAGTISAFLILCFIWNLLTGGFASKRK